MANANKFPNATGLTLPELEVNRRLIYIDLKGMGLWVASLLLGHQIRP